MKREFAAQVGEDLQAIRDQKLYRCRYKTFEEFCQKEHNISRQHAYQLMNAADIAAALVPLGISPTSERQIRPLAALKEPEQQREAFQAAVDAAGGAPTAKQVQAEVEKRLSPPLRAPVGAAPAQEYDRWTEEAKQELMEAILLLPLPFRRDKNEVRDFFLHAGVKPHRAIAIAYCFSRAGVSVRQQLLEAAKE